MLSVAVFGLISVLLPGLSAGGQWRVGDRLFFAGVGLSIAALLWRYATIRATPTREALTIRNLFTTRTVPWHGRTRPRTLREDGSGGWRSALRSLGSWLRLGPRPVSASAS